MATIRIGTRAGALAMAQTEFIIDLLRRNFPDIKFEIVTITTKGDADRKSPLEKIGGAGVFTKRIEMALLNNKIDIAVHSAKDLPSKMTPGLKIGAVPRRESPNDAWLSADGKSLNDTAASSTVGTGSPRRQAMLLHIRPDLKAKDIRGNVPTRLKKLEDGLYDSLIMAYAGLKRIGLDIKITQVLPLNIFLPAPGQGALIAQIREYDRHPEELLKTIDDSEAHRCLDVERWLLEMLDAGCSAAIGGLAQIENGTLEMRVSILDKHGATRLDEMGSSTAAAGDREMIADLVKELLARGADKLIT